MESATRESIFTSSTAKPNQVWTRDAYAKRKHFLFPITYNLNLVEQIELLEIYSGHQVDQDTYLLLLRLMESGHLSKSEFKRRFQQAREILISNQVSIDGRLKEIWADLYLAKGRYFESQKQHWQSLYSLVQAKHFKSNISNCSSQYFERNILSNLSREIAHGEELLNHYKIFDLLAKDDSPIRLKMLARFLLTGRQEVLDSEPTELFWLLRLSTFSETPVVFLKNRHQTGILAKIKSFYLGEIDIFDLLERVGEYCESLPQQTLWDRLLILALFSAVYRCALRTKKVEITKALEPAYRLLSQNLSDFQTDDYFRIFESTATLMPQFRKLGALPVFLRFVASMGQKRLAQLFSLRPEKRVLKKREAVALLNILADELAKVKGPLLKIGQTVSYFGLSLPNTIQRKISKLQDSSPQIPFSEISETLSREIPNYKDQFELISNEPIGVGSIGQVHFAQMRTAQHTHKSVAIKVRFTNVENMVRSDINFLRILTPIFKLFLPSTSFLKMFSEIEDMMLDECNYLKEYQNQIRAAELFHNHEKILIPKALSATREVLISEYSKGDSLNEFLKYANPTQKNEILALIFEFYFTCFSRGLLHVDPHPGNFLVEDGKLVVIDFGSVATRGAEEEDLWLGMLSMPTGMSDVKFKSLIEAMDVPGNKMKFNHRDFKSRLFENSVVFMKESRSIDFSKNGGFGSVLKNVFSGKNPNLKYLNFPASTLFIIRAFLGYFALASYVGGTVNTREIMKKCSPEVFKI